jgi:hypothetical protein
VPKSAALLLATLLIAATATAPRADENAGIRVVSSTPWTVTGGDALVEVPVAGKVLLNGEDLTARFRPEPGNGRRLGLISGLHDGRNTLEVADRRSRNKITLINYGIDGPVFSGPHQVPFLCETQAFKLPDGDMLGPSQQPGCWAPTNIQHLYKSTVDGRLKPFKPGAVPVSEIAKATTSEGVTVDYVVRLETGVVNRAVYQVAVLAKPDEPVSPFARPAGWNGRLIYAFGGGCGPAYRQGRATVGVIDNPEFGNDPLDRGYAIATATLNTLGQNCNDVTSAETAMMVKERFIETFGPPRFVIGWGGSGGAQQQNLIQANYPGILDGLIPGRSFPDSIGTLISAADCPLLHHYLKDAPGWSEAQKTAVAGFPRWEHCASAWFNYMPRIISPLGTGCDASAFVTPQEGGAVARGAGAAPATRLYDPKAAPDGVRCGYFDNAVNIWGRGPDGSARRPLDNIGVQYGLDAFNRGIISFAQFAELNRKIGGFDADAQFTTERMRADPEALRIAYATGRVNQGQGMDLVPIIDLRSYVDDVSPPDIHTAQATDTARIRWQSANGQAANLVSWITASRGSLREDVGNPMSPLRVATRQAIAAMDAWLVAIQADRSASPAARKVVTHRPSGLQDACFDEEGRHDLSTDDGRACRARLPSHADPRIAAGEPPARLHMKCALSSVRASGYATPLSPDQLAELREVFPQGVCDYGRRPVGHTRPAGTWLSFQGAGRYGVLPRE